MHDVITAVAGGLALTLLTAIWRNVRRIAQLPDRVDRIETENRRAHGDLWTALNQIKAELLNQRRR